MREGRPFPGCPQPPAWRLEWEAIVDRNPFLQPLADCPQDPVYHREGDVLTHTQKVCEALVGDERWRGASARNRSVLFAAALFHDAAKPWKTVKDADGRIHSSGHAAKSAMLARRMLYRGEPAGFTPAFEPREQIVDLVRHHGLPLQWLQREEAERDVIQATLRAPGRWFGILAEADVLGRISEDRDELLERVRLFEAFCRDTGCEDGPRAFPSRTTRFHYLRGKRPSPDIEVYDASGFEVILMSGLPGAGKDAWIEKQGRGLPVVSLDSIRGRLGIPPSNNQGMVVSKAKEEARTFLRKGTPFIWNATNVTFPMRGSLVQMFLNYRARVRIVYVETTYQNLLARNNRRRKPVPPAVLGKLIDRLETPSPVEAHDVQWVVDERTESRGTGLGS